MKKRKTGKRVLALVLTAVLLAGICPLYPLESNAMTVMSEEEFKELLGTYTLGEGVPLYKEYQADKDGNIPGQTIEVDAGDFSRYEENGAQTAPQTFENYEGMEGTSVLTAENGLIEYDIDVAESGWYDLSVVYYPIEGKSSEIQRGFFVDGELPYRELADVEFSRVWKIDVDDKVIDGNGIEVKAWESDNQGNDMKPSMVEIPEWVTTSLYDSDGYVLDNLALYLEKGEHTISIVSRKEPMLLRKIILGAEEKADSYETVKAGWDAQGAKATSGHMIRIEAENVIKTSSQMLYPQQDQSSPTVYPSSAKELLNNSIGGNSWRLSGQWMEWEFDVPESGYYNISLYAKQNFTRGIYVSRKIFIDGKVPFEEFNDYGFTYEQSWREDTLSDENGTPYEIYLEEGKHTLRMQVVLGEFSEIVSEVQECVEELNAIYRKVIRITGVSPDSYRDYEITASLPGLEQEMTVVRDKLNHAIDSLRAAAGGSSDKETVLITMRDQLNDLIEDQEYFVKVISTFRINIRATGTWITQVIAQPLQLDRIYITSPDTKTDVKNASFFAKAGYEFKRLYYSFVIDYNQIGNVAEEGNENPTITLWVGTGRDQANVIKSLIDESFTSDTGINVNVQLVDMNTLLRAELAGEGPDVAIQVANTNGIAGAVLNTGNDTPVNYGLRNAVLDLTQFDDWQEVTSRFYESSLTAFTFDGAVYALPETQTFPVMFYRKDILAEVGLDIPQTWDEVKVAMTVLAKNQMEFAMLPSEQIFAMLLYQNGGEYYTEGGKASALDSDIAISTFKEYCEYYTDYGLDTVTSAEERFRTGEAPIMIADYTVYNNLQVSAPDIKGVWDFAPVPGVVKEDGTIDRSVGCTGLASIIMSDTEYPEECWEFLKWWTSADVQILFDRELESLMGSAARVATANQEAFESLPWPVETYEVLAEQFKWVKGIPQVPGGYYSWRNVNNAFYTVTTDKDTATPREQLMDKVIYINDEINYKRKEFGLPLAED